MDYKRAGSRAGVDGIVNGGDDLISAGVAGDVGCAVVGRHSRRKGDRDECDDLPH